MYKNNPNGHVPNLVPAHPGNRNADRHGAYSARAELEPADEELVEELLALPHLVPADRLAAERVALLTAQLRRIENTLADGVVEGKRGNARDLIDVWRRMNAELREFLDRLGLTPKGRAEWASTLGRGTLADEIRRRLEESS